MSVLNDHMLAFGSCIAGFGILLTGLLALLFRNPDAPRWTRPEIVAMLACVPVTATTGLGLGYAVYGVMQLVKGTGNPPELLALAPVLIVLVLAWRVFGIRRRLKQYGAATAGTSPSVYLVSEPTLVIDEGSPPRPKPRAGSTRKAA